MDGLKRCNLEKTTHGYRLCLGDHERAQPCKWIYLIPVEALRVAEDEINSAYLHTGDADCQSHLDAALEAVRGVY